MNTEQRAVLDTNVVVSALLFPRSVPRQAFERAFATGRVLISAATLSELDDVVRRPAFDRYSAPDLRLEFVATLAHQAILVEVTERLAVCRDPKDDIFLELAVNGQATYIISGDHDLLALHPFRGIPILTPQDFLLLA